MIAWEGLDCGMQYPVHCMIYVSPPDFFKWFSAIVKYQCNMKTFITEHCLLIKRHPQYYNQMRNTVTALKYYLRLAHNVNFCHRRNRYFSNKCHIGRNKRPAIIWYLWRGRSQLFNEINHHIKHVFDISFLWWQRVL